MSLLSSTGITTLVLPDIVEHRSRDRPRGVVSAAHKNGRLQTEEKLASSIVSASEFKQRSLVTACVIQPVADCLGQGPR